MAEATIHQGADERKRERESGMQNGYFDTERM